MTTVGFIVLSHRNEAQLLRLTQVLNKLYGDSPIACHHDFSQCALDPLAFPSNVRFVDPSIRTGWGKYSLVEATLSALHLLYATSDPDYFFLISAADYPTARADQVREDLTASPADAFIDAFSLEDALRSKPEIGDAHLVHHRAAHNLKLERGRYLRAQLMVPIVRWRPPQHSTTDERYPRLGRITKDIPFNSAFSPFDGTYRCYVGSQWFTANRKAAAKLLAPSAKDLRLRKYYRNRFAPDESYFQTVIRNDRDLKSDIRTFRHAIWDGAHPIDIGERHIASVLDARAHFTRKFLPNDPVLDIIDRHLGVSAR
jgi:hypothetical protein